MKIVLYTTHCPRCEVLQSKLDAKGVKYDVVTDEEIMIKKNFLSAPMLEVDGKVMNFSEAIKWTNQEGLQK